jgi:hypothetical protein
MESGGDHVQRREDAYRRAGDVHGRAERLEADAASFFNQFGDADAASRHARNAARQGELADADIARATAASHIST